VPQGRGPWGGHRWKWLTGGLFLILPQVGRTVRGLGAIAPIGSPKTYPKTVVKGGFKGGFRGDRARSRPTPVACCSLVTPLARLALSLGPDQRHPLAYWIDGPKGHGSGLGQPRDWISNRACG